MVRSVFLSPRYPCMTNDFHVSAATSLCIRPWMGCCPVQRAVLVHPQQFYDVRMTAGGSQGLDLPPGTMRILADKFQGMPRGLPLMLDAGCSSSQFSTAHLSIGTNSKHFVMTYTVDRGNIRKRLVALRRCTGSRRRAWWNLRRGHCLHGCRAMEIMMMITSRARWRLYNKPSLVLPDRR